MAQIQTVKKNELKKWSSWSKVKEEAEEDLLLQLSMYAIGTINALKKMLKINSFWSSQIIDWTINDLVTQTVK